MAGPEHIKTLLAIATRKHLDSDFTAAEQLYREILFEAPDDAEARHYLGFLLQQTGREAEAVEQLSAAIALDDTHADWHFNLGIALLKLNLPDAAIEAFTAAIVIDPHQYFYWTNLGAAFEAANEDERAEQCYTAATKIDPNCPDAFNLLSVMYLAQERFAEARHCHYRAIVAAPSEVKSRIILGHAYYELGQMEDAIAVYNDWLLAEPGNPVATHLLTAYCGEPAPEQCTRQYIEQSFDAFAGDFDQVLGKLNYRGPQLVREYIAGLSPAATGLDVLDLGCGTGLTGASVKTYASQLTGVDLSQAMLDRAAARQIYQHLHKADITDYLAATRDRYDLVTCMDTLIYIGRLDKVFTLIRQCLKPGGLLIFSTEKPIAANASGYQLNISGRYSHHQDYLTVALTGAGLRIELMQDVPIRTEMGYAIPGQFVCASRI
jgi:predicted TPR repeat methyltransferase